MPEPIAAILTGVAGPAEAAGVTGATAAASTEAAATAGAATNLATETAKVATEGIKTVGEGAEVIAPSAEAVAEAKALEGMLEGGTSPGEVLEKHATGGIEPAGEATGKTETDVGETVDIETKTTTEGKEPPKKTTEEKKVDETKGEEQETVSPEDQKAIDTHVETGLSQWDQANPEPDSATNPDKYNEWCKARVEIQNKLEVDATVNHGLKKWEADNPKPDKLANPKEFNEWVKQRAEKESQIRKAEEDKRKEKKPAKEMSAAEIEKKRQRLQQLRTVRNASADAIKAINAKETKTPEDKVQLARLEAQLVTTDTEIKVIEEELKAVLPTVSWQKKLLIIAALLGTAAVVGASHAAKG